MLDNKEVTDLCPWFLGGRLKIHGVSWLFMNPQYRSYVVLVTAQYQDCQTRDSNPVIRGLGF